MIEVTLPLHDGTDLPGVDICAEVTKLGPNDYVVIWKDEAAVAALKRPCHVLAHYARCCELEYELLEYDREESGISSILDDRAPTTSHDRDGRISEVATA